VINRFATEAGDVPLGPSPIAAGQDTMATALPRQLIYEVEQNGASSFAVAGATQAAEAALKANPKWGTLVQTLAGVVDSRDGARLRAIAFTDSPTGFIAADAVGVMEQAMGTRGRTANDMRFFTEHLVKRDPNTLPAGHTTTSGSREEPGTDHAAWIVIGPQISAAVRYFLGDSPTLGPAWPAKFTAAGRGSEAQQAVAAMVGETLAHEGWHARLSRQGTPHADGTFPFDLDEGRTQLANHLSGSAAVMTRALGMSDAKAVASTSDKEVYADQVLALGAKLDKVGVPADGPTRQAFIEGRTLGELQATVGA
jgi:hypothetical protein